MAATQDWPACSGRRSGATAIEYALLAGLIATVIIGAVMSLGPVARTRFYGDTNTELVSHMDSYRP